MHLPWQAGLVLEHTSMSAVRRVQHQDPAAMHSCSGAQELRRQPGGNGRTHLHHQPHFRVGVGQHLLLDVFEVLHQPLRVGGGQLRPSSWAKRRACTVRKGGAEAAVRRRRVADRSAGARGAPDPRNSAAPEQYAASAGPATSPRALLRSCASAAATDAAPSSGALQRCKLHAMVCRGCWPSPARAQLTKQQRCEHRRSGELPRHSAASRWLLHYREVRGKVAQCGSSWAAPA